MTCQMTDDRHTKQTKSGERVRTGDLIDRLLAVMQADELPGEDEAPKELLKDCELKHKTVDEYIADKYGIIIGSEVHLESVDGLQWIEISKDTLRDYRREDR